MPAYTIEQKVEQARSLGASPEEIEMVVRHGNTRTREAVGRAVRADWQPPFEAPDVHASNSALMLSILEGTDANWDYNWSQAKTTPAIQMDQYADVWAAEYAAQPAEAVLDMDRPAESLSAAQDTLSDPTRKRVAAVVSRTATAGPRDEDDSVGIAAQAERARSILDITAAILAPVSTYEESDMAVLQAGAEQRARLGEDSARTSTAVGLLAELAPRGTWDYAALARTARDLGVIDDNLWDLTLGTVSGGWTTEKIREYVSELAPEKRPEFFRNLWETYNKNVGFAETTFNTYAMMESLNNDEFLRTNDPVDTLDKVMNNLASGLSLLELAGYGLTLAGMFRILRRLPAGLRIVQVANSGKAHEILRQALTQMDDASLARLWQVDKQTLALSDLPKPGLLDDIENLPDEISREVDLDRTRSLVGDVYALANRQNINMFTTKERTGIIESLARSATNMHGARLRAGRSRIAVFENEDGVRMFNVVGKDESYGFPDLKEAFEYAGRKAAGDDVRYLRVEPDGTLKEFKPKMRQKEDGSWEPAPGQKGEFYVEFRHDHYFSPMDAALFDDAPVIAGTWMGRALTHLVTPSAYLDQNVVGKFTRAFTREQGMVNLLDSIMAPVFKDLSSSQRLKVNDVMLWAENFGKQNGRVPSVTEIRGQFPDLTNKEIGGYYQSRIFHDTVWQLQNDRLFRNWSAQGYKTLEKGGVRYHGKPVPATTAIKKADGSFSVLDPETGTSVRMTQDEMTALHERGGQLIKIDRPMEGSKGELHEYIVYDPSVGWRMNKLSRHPLKYVPGYFTRMYRDAHFIQRIDEAASVDGGRGRHVSTLQVAATRQEAEVRRTREMDRQGRRLYKGAWDSDLPIASKERLLAAKGLRVQITDDFRLSDQDRVAIDLQRFQTEGRLFFDDRQQEALTDVYGNPADIVDPINTIQRVSRMVSRQVATEDLVRAQKANFFSTYKGRIEGLNPRATSTEVHAFLKAQIREKGAGQAREATEALAWWNYIRAMEGSLSQTTALFRRQAIGAAEWFDVNVGWKIGARGVTKEVARNAHNLSLIEGAKKLAFFHFITARPLRQLILQGSQHLALQALDPAYAGRWQMDSLSLLSAVKRLGRTRDGRKLYTLKNKQMGAMLGLDAEETQLLIREFSLSGLVDTVDVHSYAGGLPKSATVTHQTAVARAAQSAKNVALTIPDKMRAMGFDLGEQYNVTASYLMALRRHRKENGIKKLTDMTRDDWDAVANRGSQYALAMHRANAATWQYGLVSLPMQFLQFTHKWLLTVLGAVPGARKLGLANQAFTTRESMKIVAGQILMWGSSGLAIKDMVEESLAGSDISEDQKQLISSGILDWAVDTMFRILAEDPELDFAIDETFSPSAGFRQTAGMFAETAFETPLATAFFGPSGEVFGRLGKAVQMGQAIAGREFEHWSPEQKAQAAVEATAAGLMAGYSDLLKVRLAAKVGQWTNTAGEGLGIEAKFEELVMKGMLGVNPQKLLDYYDLAETMRDMEQSAREDARTHARNIARIVSQWGDGMKSLDEARAQINMLGIVAEEYREQGKWLFFQEHFMEEINRLKTEQKGMWEVIGDMFSTGYTPDEVRRFIESPMFSPEQQKYLTKWYEDAITQRDWSDPIERERLERELKLIDEMRQNENGE